MMTGVKIDLSAWIRVSRHKWLLAVVALGLAGSLACGGGSSPAPTPPSPPSVPGQVTGLTATAGINQIALSWTAVSGATSYNVERGAASTGPFTSIATPTATTYNDASATAGVTYYYEVAAVNASGTGTASAVASATATGTLSAQITVDALSNRHAISPLVYGVNFPPSASYITATGTTFVRWGGNNSTDYNWTNFDANLDNDWYFQDDPFGALGLNSSTTGADSQAFVKDVVAAGADPLMTMPILTTKNPVSGITAGWVAKGGPQYDSFSVAKYNYTPCEVNPDVSDDGDGIDSVSTCALKANQYSSYAPQNPVYVTGNDFADAYAPLLNAPGLNDPAGAVYRSQWAQALAPDFGNDPHFYDMDNEMDIWQSTHRDIHPNPVTYQEQADDFVNVGAGLKTWDAKAFTFGPVTCCWEGYWNSGAGASDKAAHGDVDFWPWWLNDVYWRGKVAGVQIINDFDFHAYPELTIPAGAAAPELDALGLASTRDWWDIGFTNADSWIGNNPGAGGLQPVPTVQARLVRALALANEIMPGLPVSVTEWNFGQTNEDPIAVALTDADGWGLLGQYDLYAAARWTAPDPSANAPSYQTLNLFTNYDGKHDGFDPISVGTSNTCGLSAADPFYNECYAFAAVNAAGTQMTLLVVNQNPADQLQATLNLKNFTASQVTSYSISAASPNSITAGATGSFSANQTFAPYSITLLVISGQMSSAPAADWALNPENAALASLSPNTPYFPPGIVMASAGTSVVLHPVITSGSGTVTLSGMQTDSGISGAITTAAVQASVNAAVTFTIPATAAPGFYNFTLTGQDGSGVTQTKAGIIEVGNPAATLTATGNNQSAAAGGTLNLSVTVVPGTSGTLAAGQEILFTTSAGTLSAASDIAVSASGNQILVDTNASGAANVTLTLPSAPGTVQVTAKGEYAIGHPISTFTETAQ